MSDHTPGPWQVGIGGLHGNRVWTADMKPVAMMVSHTPSPPDICPIAQANARLIAAAPALAEALRCLLDVFAYRNAPVGKRLVAAQNARAALKAAGVE